MSLGRLKNPLAAALTAAAFAAALAAPGDAEASGPVQTWGKGTAGGALLGGEVVIIPMGAAGVSRGWPYFVFGGLGMVGGAVGGYFLDKHFAYTTDANGNVTGGGPSEPSMGMLAGGLALVIPAVILALNATAYRPPDGDRNEPANNEPAKDSPRPSPAPPPAAPAPAPGEVPPPGPTTSYRYHSRYRAEVAAIPRIPTSLLESYQGKIGFGVPGVQVKPLYSQAEMVRYGVTQGTEVQVPVFKAMF